MKKTLLYIFMLSVILLNQRVEACVGKTLFIGVTDAPNERLFAEMISVLVAERTGTSVKIVSYKDARDLYSAVKKGEVGLFIDNADRALNILGKPPETNSRTAYETVKKACRASQNLVWLEPFGGSQYYAPVISLETINNLPALPKLVNKLGGMVNDETCARLLRAVKGDDKAKKVAKDFLKSRKLI